MLVMRGTRHRDSCATRRAEVQRISSDFFLTTLDQRVIHCRQPGNDDLAELETVLRGDRPDSVFDRSVSLLSNPHEPAGPRARERSAAIGTLFVETLLGVRLVACFNSSE